MSKNPFFRRKPIRQVEHFYNRRTCVNCTLDLLRKLQNVAIVGPRRIGKTSFLYHILDPTVLRAHSIDPERSAFIYIDCQGLSPLGQEEIYRSILTRIIDTLNGVGVDIGPIFRDKQMTYTLFEKTLKEINQRGLRIVLLLDEFEALSRNSNLDESFFSGLRALPGQCDLAYVTASCVSLDELHREDRSLLSSNFFNTFYPTRLGLFNRDDSQHLIEESLRKVGERFSPQVLELVLEMGGNHPFFLQIAGHWAYSLSKASRKPTEVERCALLKGTYSEAVGHFRYFWQKLREQERYVLAALPLLSNDTNFRGRIEYLREQCLVDRRDGEYSYFSPLLEAFVRRQEVSELIQTGHLLIDRRREQVLLRGVPLSLSPTNYALLVYLVERVGRVVSSEELWQAVWPDEHYIDDERLKSGIKSLRKTLGDDAEFVANKRGVGYYIDLACLE